MKEKNIVRRDRFFAISRTEGGAGGKGGIRRGKPRTGRTGTRRRSFSSPDRASGRAGRRVFRQRIDDVDHAWPVEQCIVGCGRACRQRGPHRLRAPLHAQRLLRQNFWRSPRLTIACDRESDEWPFALSDTDAVASTGRPSASSVVPDACWYAPSRYTLVRFDRS